MNSIFSVLILFAFTNAFASTSQQFVCDMRELTRNDTNTGLVKIEVFPDRAILKAGIFGDKEVAVLSLIKAGSESSTLYLGKNSNGKVQESFDLLPSGKTGIFIWRIYDWKSPYAFDRSTIHICNEANTP